MTKKHFIALANAIRDHNRTLSTTNFTEDQLVTLAEFCRDQNSNFNRERWLDYIVGKCGPSGGAVKR